MTPSRHGLLNLTGTIQTVQSLHLDLAGTATDDHGVAKVLVSLRDATRSNTCSPTARCRRSFATLPATLASGGDELHVEPAREPSHRGRLERHGRCHGHRRAVRHLDHRRDSALPGLPR